MKSGSPRSVMLVEPTSAVRIGEAKAPVTVSKATARVANTMVKEMKVGGRLEKVSRRWVPLETYILFTPLDGT